MHSTFLPGLPLPDLHEVQVGPLYHTTLPDGRIATVQLTGDGWVWRSLTGGRVLRGTRSELEAWLTHS